MLGKHIPCQRCNGTGRLGVRGAEPEIEIIPRTYKGSRSVNGGIIMQPIETGWYWSHRGTPTRGTLTPRGGPFPTESEALAAARKDHREHP